MAEIDPLAALDESTPLAMHIGSSQALSAIASPGCARNLANALGAVVREGSPPQSQAPAQAQTQSQSQAQSQAQS